MTENDSAIELLAKQYPDITENQLALYRVSLALPPVPAKQSAELYELFLLGKTLQEIADITGTGLGLVVRACIEDKWAERRAEYMEGLMAMTHGKVNKMQLEFLGHLALEVAVYSKLYEPNMLKFIMSGDKADLAGVPLMSLKTLSEIMSKLNEKPPAVNVTINEKGKQDETVTIKRSSPEDTLKRLAKKVKNESGEEE